MSGLIGFLLFCAILGIVGAAATARLNPPRVHPLEANEDDQS